MKRRICLIALLVFFVSLGAQQSHAIWISGYYPGWTQDRLKPSDVDYTAVTHIMHHSLLPNADGTLNTTTNVITPHIATTVTATHAAGKKILIVIGGADSNVLFNAATTTAIRPKLIANLVNFVKINGYDGVDVDWEPSPATDKPRFEAFVRELRAALNTQVPGSLMTAAVYDNAEGRAIVKDVTGEFDQINMMTYIMSGPWESITWHNSPLFNGGFTFPGGGPLPSIDLDVDSFIAAGIPKAKLGIGAEFGGALWTGGVTGPRQSYSGNSVQFDVPYYTIIANYFQPQHAKYDTIAQMAYLGIDNSGTTQDMFLSYENEQSLAKKIEYIKSKSIGGMIIWELDAGYLADKPAGQRDPLLKAVKAAVGGTSPTAPPTASPGVTTCPAVQGDANGDGRVSLTDYEVWRGIFSLQ